MSMTLTICSYVLVALGVLLNIWLFPHPLAFIPYVLLFFAARAARRSVARIVVLVVTLCSVCIGFWFCFDAAFIRLSTLNFLPLEIAVVKSLVAGLLLLAIHRLERFSDEPKIAEPPLSARGQETKKLLTEIRRFALAVRRAGTPS
jgi:hypothetical protein